MEEENRASSCKNDSGGRRTEGANRSQGDQRGQEKEWNMGMDGMASVGCHQACASGSGFRGNIGCLGQKETGPEGGNGGGTGGAIHHGANQEAVAAYEATYSAAITRMERPVFRYGGGLGRAALGID